jgi:hypothetical protein
VELLAGGPWPVLRLKFTKTAIENREVFTFCKTLEIKENELNKPDLSFGTREMLQRSGKKA